MEGKRGETGGKQGNKMNSGWGVHGWALLGTATKALPMPPVRPVWPSGDLGGVSRMSTNLDPKSRRATQKCGGAAGLEPPHRGRYLRSRWQRSGPRSGAPRLGGSNEGKFERSNIGIIGILHRTRHALHGGGRQGNHTHKLIGRVLHSLQEAVVWNGDPLRPNCTNP